MEFGLAMAPGVSFIGHAPLDDVEDLYRSVRHSEMVQDNGLWRPTSQAFGDRRLRTSVDIAFLAGNDPSRSRKAPVNGQSQWVVGLKVGQARSAGSAFEMIDGVDVVPAPLDGNPAHAEIVLTPEHEKAHRRLRGYFAKVSMVVLAAE